MVKSRIQKEVDILKKQGLNASIICNEEFDKNSNNLVLIKKYKLPKKNNNYFVDPKNTIIGEVDIIIVFPYAYPRTRLDMFWVYPPIAKRGQINVLTPLGIRTITCGIPNPYTLNCREFEGKKWQMWSKHFTSWNPNENDINDLMILIKKSFEDEL